VCTEARAATNSFFADFNGAGAARKAELAEALATQTRARAARATDSDLREQLGRLAELLSSWAHGSAQNAQAYADTLNAACRPWFG
jgi:hypothetical protein